MLKKQKVKSNHLFSDHRSSVYQLQKRELGSGKRASLGLHIKMRNEDGIPIAAYRAGVGLTVNIHWIVGREYECRTTFGDIISMCSTDWLSVATAYGGEPSYDGVEVRVESTATNKCRYAYPFFDYHHRVRRLKKVLVRASHLSPPHLMIHRRRN